MIAYQRNYDLIASDHVSWWRETGRNPFQNPSVLRANEDQTVALVERHCEQSGDLLDAGCGMGDLLSRLPTYRGVGVDIAGPYLSVAGERGLDVRRARIEKLPFPAGSFDAVVATDILEHVLDVNAAVKEILRVLRPGGVVIVRVPDMEPVAWNGQHYEFVHLRIFDEGTLRILFEVIFGCEVLECFHGQNTIHLAARK